LTEEVINNAQHQSSYFQTKLETKGKLHSTDGIFSDHRVGVTTKMTQLKCPQCGRRIIDSEKNVKTEIRIIKTDNDWIPDYYTKCWNCKSEIGIKKTK
jgi:predicted RNA-binding Zn-ribbon protein involved in translation (DUF1610 family)